MNEARFQTAGLSDFNNTEIPKCWLRATAFVFWWPQLLKLDMVCRIPRHIDATRHQNEYVRLWYPY